MHTNLQLMTIKLIPLLIQLDLLLDLCHKIRDRQPLEEVNAYAHALRYHFCGRSNWGIRGRLFQHSLEHLSTIDILHVAGVRGVYIHVTRVVYVL